MTDYQSLKQKAQEIYTQSMELTPYKRQAFREQMVDEHEPASERHVIRTYLQNIYDAKRKQSLRTGRMQAVSNILDNDKAKTECEHPGCTVLRKGKGLCKKHYNQARYAKSVGR